MGAKSDTETAIMTLSEEMLAFDGTEGKTKAEADAYHAEQMAIIIDNHCKALVGKATSAKIGALGLIAGAYPVLPGPTPISQDLEIGDPALEVPDVEVSE